MTAHFGLGKARRGMVEVVWPGNVRNRLYNVRSGERITFPEIPCNFASTTTSRKSYDVCVKRSLNQLVRAGAINSAARDRFYASALTAFDDAH
jgi:hypothetical protein